MKNIFICDGQLLREGVHVYVSNTCVAQVCDVKVSSSSGCGSALSHLIT